MSDQAAFELFMSKPGKMKLDNTEFLRKSGGGNSPGTNAQEMCINGCYQLYQQKVKNEALSIALLIGTGFAIGYLFSKMI